MPKPSSRELPNFWPDWVLELQWRCLESRPKGVLQEDLGKLLEVKTNCKLRVLLALQANLLAPAAAASSPPAPPSTPTRTPPSGSHIAANPGSTLVLFDMPSVHLGMSRSEFVAQVPGAESHPGVDPADREDFWARIGISDYKQGQIIFSFQNDTLKLISFGTSADISVRPPDGAMVIEGSSTDPRLTANKNVSIS